MISIALVIPLYSGQYSELVWATRVIARTEECTFSTSCFKHNSLANLF